MRTLAAALILLLLAGTLAAEQPASAEIADSRMAVGVHERSGSFSLYALLPGQQRVPLLFAPDPSTSVLSVLENDRIHRMGFGGGFEQSIDHQAGSLALRWRSPTLEIEQRFTTANAIEGSADGEISVTNRSETPRRVALRYVLDTWLGEQHGVHFETADGQVHDREYLMQPDAGNGYWVSSDSRVSLVYLAAGPAVSDADAVVFANWKRLKDVRWDYAVNPQRSFDLIPYSMNDSAAAVYYAGRTIEPGGSYSVRFIVGVGDSLGRLAQAEQRPPARDSAAQPPGRARDRRSIEHDLDAVNALLRDINRRLGSERQVTDSEVEALRERLPELNDGQRSR